MPRFLPLLLLPVLLLAAACGGSSESSDDSSARPIDDVFEIEPDGSEGTTSDASLEDLFASVNPFEVLGGFDSLSSGSTSEVDPSLTGALIALDDLPGDFSSLEELAYALDGAELAGRMFTTGDPNGVDMGTTVMSLAIGVPPELIDLINDEGGFDQLDELADDYLAGSGLEGFGSFEVLDGSGLGDSGVGMRIEIDLAGFFELLQEGFEGFGDDLEQEEDLPFGTGIAMEIYMFVEGNKVLAAATVWATDSDPEVEARDLAEIMDGRVGD